MPTQIASPQGQYHKFQQQPTPYPPYNTAQKGGPNKTQILLYVLIGLVIVVGGVVTYALMSSDRHGTSTETATTTTIEENGPTPEEIARQHKETLLADYKALLRKNQNEEYVVTDLNDNGFPELWITYNVGKNRDYMYHVYHSEGGHAREIFSAPVGSLSVHGSFVLIDNADDSDYVTKYTYDGQRVSQREISRDEYGYAADRATSCTDPTELTKAFE